MLNALYNALLEWNRTATDRMKMQHLYLSIAIIALVVAGVVSLIDRTTGQDILVVTVVALAVYLLNAVLWALLESSLLSKLTNRRKR